MWIADNWKDYEVLDTSDGEKLERWGDYILVRPDPQVIWSTGHDAKEWKQKNGHYHRSVKGGGQWEFFDLPNEWTISYRELTFHLKPFSFKHTGLFPEQAVNWDWCAQKIRAAREKDPGRELKVLNLFAYTAVLRSPQQMPVQMSHMSMPPKEWLRGQKKMRFQAIFPAIRSAGW